MVHLGVDLRAGIRSQTWIRNMQNNAANDNQSKERAGNLLEAQLYMDRPASIFTSMAPYFSNLTHPNFNISLCLQAQFPRP